MRSEFLLIVIFLILSVSASTQTLLDEKRVVFAKDKTVSIYAGGVTKKDPHK